MYKLHQFDTEKYKSHKYSGNAGQDEDDFFASHMVYKNNKNYFIVVETGDDMATISKKTGISLRKLYKYNDLSSDYVPTQGDLIYLQKKRSCASREFRHNPIHIVEANQSMFDISQLYGIRLKSLYKMNNMDYSYQIKPGDILRIR